MIWIVKGNESHQIVSSNVYHKENISELWVTRVNGKNLKVFEGEEKDAKEMKEAIDYSISIGAKVYNID